MRRIPTLSALLFVACSSSPSGAPPLDAGRASDALSEGSVAPSRGVVDVYLGAGDAAGSAGCYFLSDALAMAQGCRLYRVKMRLSDGEALEHELAVAPPAGEGVWQPTARGGKLAFSHTTKTSVRVRLREARGPASSDLGADVMTGAGLWVWPNIAADGRVRIDTSRIATTPGCIVPSGPAKGQCQEIDRWGEVHEVTASGTSTLVAGRTGFAFSDPWSHPLEPNIVAAHGKVHRDSPATFPSCDKSTSCSATESKPWPIIVDTSKQVGYVIKPATRDPLVAPSGGILELGGCAHLAWSPSGTKWLCTEQSTDALVGGPYLNRVYVAEFEPTKLAANSVTQVELTPAFTHKQAAEVFALGAGQACDVFYHKYAEYCGSDDVIVATVGCGCSTDTCKRVSGSDVTLIGSRIFLIDASSPGSPRYLDVTAKLESRLGVASNALTGFTATCAAE